MTFIDHAPHQGYFFRHLMECIALGQYRVKTFCHVAHQVDADQVVEAEYAGLGNSHRSTEYGVGILGSEPQAECSMQCCLYGKYADPVAEKTRRVLTQDDAFAHTRFIELFEAIDNFLSRVLTAYDLEQAHVTYGVEEMRNRELGPEVLRHIFYEH